MASDPSAALTSLHQGDSGVDIILRKVLDKFKRDLRDAFRKLDKDNSGLLCKSEFAVAFRGLDIEIDQDQLNDLFLAFDADKSGEISYNEFVGGFDDMQHADHVLRKLRERVWQRWTTDLQAAFLTVDKDRSGHVNKQEFFQMIKKFSLPQSDEDFDEAIQDRLWAKFDKNEDESITYREFLAVFGAALPAIADNVIGETPRGGQDVALANALARYTTTLPKRFSAPTNFKTNVRKQHPMYETSNNDYGFKGLRPQDMPVRWHGRHGKFSKNFNGGPIRNHSLNTAVSKSKIHDQFDKTY